jgi:hypothetical protein
MVLMREFFALILGAVALGIIGINMYGRFSADPKHIVSDIEVSLREKWIEIAAEDNVLETLAPTERSKFLVGWTFYNVLYNAKEIVESDGYEAIGVNSLYSERYINIYFIDPARDKLGLLKKYNVYNARSFPEFSLIVINIDFLRKLKLVQPYVENRTGRQIEYGIQGSEQTSDKLLLRLEEPIEGIVPWTVAELHETQALFIGMYIVMHEIGHVHDFWKSGKYEYDRKSSKEKEVFADRFFATVFSGLKDVPEFSKAYETAFSMGTDGMLTYLSEKLIEKTGKTGTAIFEGTQDYPLRDSIFATHPPMIHRILQVLYYIFQENNRSAANDRNFTGSERFYGTLLKRTPLEWSILP